MTAADRYNSPVVALAAGSRISQITAGGRVVVLADSTRAGWDSLYPQAVAAIGHRMVTMRSRRIGGRR